MNRSYRASLSLSFPTCKMGISCFFPRQAARLLQPLGPWGPGARILKLVRYRGSEARGQLHVGQSEAGLIRPWTLLSSGSQPTLMTYSYRAGAQGWGEAMGLASLETLVLGTCIGQALHRTLHMHCLLSSFCRRRHQNSESKNGMSKATQLARHSQSWKADLSPPRLVPVENEEYTAQGGFVCRTLPEC